GVGEHHPAGARTPPVAEVRHDRGTQGHHPLDLLVPRPLPGPQVEVDAVLHGLRLGDLDEQEPVAGLGVLDHALLVARLVRVVGEVDVAEEPLPPLGELVRVRAVDGGVGDEAGHGSMLLRIAGRVEGLRQAAGWSIWRTSRRTKSSIATATTAPAPNWMMTAS